LIKGFIFISLSPKVYLHTPFPVKRNEIERMGKMIEIIGNKMQIVSNELAFEIAVYAFFMTFAMIIIIVKSIKRKKRFIKWKEDEINILGLFKRKYERNEDEFLQQLWEQNQLLENENKMLKKSIKDLPNMSGIALIMFSFGLWVGSKISKK
jgi:hypothetical protein